MKVLMQSRTNFYTLKGGDTIQLLKTKDELEKIGVSVDISLELEPNLDEYDLVHLSNITRIQETYIQMCNAKKQNKKVALSTIYWPMDEFEQKGQKGLRKFVNRFLSIDSIEKIKAILKFIFNKDCRNKSTLKLLTVGYTNMQKYVLKNADILLPNSEMEMEKLCDYFGMKKERYMVVPNAVDLTIATKVLDEKDDEKYAKYKDAIICVGRVETRKNQLSLLKALNDSKYKVIILGKVSKNQKKYFKSVKKLIEGNKNFYYIDELENKEIYKLYKVCKVSALPSWYDTPGLVSLEAAAMKCNLAVSSKGTTKEYFKNDAFYCEPDDIESIRLAVDKAYEKEKNVNLQKRIFKEYTWKKAAENTKKAYEIVLED